MSSTRFGVSKSFKQGVRVSRKQQDYIAISIEKIVTDSFEKTLRPEKETKIADWKRKFIFFEN